MVDEDADVKVGKHPPAVSSIIKANKHHYSSTAGSVHHR